MIKRMINSTTLEKFGKVAPPPQGAEFNIIDYFCLKDNITQDRGQHCKDSDLSHWSAASS